jgi:iron complex outermembrane recepter protein
LLSLEIPRGDGGSKRVALLFLTFRSIFILFLGISVLRICMRGRVHIREIIMKKSIIASAVALVCSSNLIAAENLNLEEVTVKANRFERKESETTYASEIHTSAQIEASGASTLYDFLAQQTSLNVLSNFGSRATPSINLRGYGGENGYQNVVISLDGQRLNNIDMVPQLIAAIPLANIDRIEISKGSGSVIYGDGATAGAIQIYTKNKTGATITSSLGNYGQKNHALNAGISEQYIDLSLTVAHDSHDGFSKRDNTGNKDKFDSNTQNVKLKIKPTDDLRFIAEGTSSRNNIGYANLLTREQFNSNPRQAGTRAYTQQSFDTDQWRVGTEFNISKEITFSATHYQEAKNSAFPTFSADYDYQSNDINFSFDNEIISAVLGYQEFNGDRQGGFDVTSKDNRASFIQTEYRPRWISDALTLSAGARNEKVRYRYKPIVGGKLNDSESLNAWDVGLNYRFAPELSIFANFNKGFQAPDIDRFFAFDAFFNVVFNGFIKPAESKTLNLGLNHNLENNRLKATIFYTKLDNEIYLDPTAGFFGTNSNIDKSHKYGLELQDYFKLNDQLSASMIYNYTRAIIDEEATLGGSPIQDKNLPGVPKHTLVTNLNWKLYENTLLNINHTWRSKAFVYSDFQNNAAQKQEHYESTNIALSYQYKKIQVFTSINNLFEHENSIQTSVDAIYPVDFVRTWRVGMKADF